VAVVAAHNEAERIGETLEALARAMPGIRLLVADDASGDGTSELAMRHGAAVVGRRRPHGKGANVTAAAQAALDEASEETTVLLCDADLGPSAAELAPLLAAVEDGGCDLAVAAFARREGGGFGIALGYARRRIEELCGFEAEAPLSGQRAMRASTLRELLPFADGFGMELGMTVDAVRAGYRVCEIELPLSHRATGRTPGGFLHRARQLRDIRRAAGERGGGSRGARRGLGG
jgi:glycosyltransferase involved in cell wall biosynthesis